MTNKQEYQKMWREANKERIKIWRKTNKAKIKKVTKKYYNKNKEKILNYGKKYNIDNRVILKNQKKEYRAKNKTKISKYNKTYLKSYLKSYEKKRMLSDPLFKLKKNLRTMICNSLKQKGYLKISKTNEILGCSFEEFKLHLESKFESWMTWNNHGLYNGELNYGWDIDHIKPLISATCENDLIQLNHYTNLQPLCSYTNRYIKKNN